MKNKQIKMSKLQLPSQKQKAVKASEETNYVVEDAANNCPMITSIIGIPLTLNVFEKMAEEEKDIQTAGERSTLLSGYFNDIAIMTTEEFVRSNQIKFKQTIMYLYNQYLPELTRLFIKDEDCKANPEMIISFSRILLCEMFTFNNACYDSYTHQLNRHPRENIDIHDLNCYNHLYNTISYFDDRLHDIRYYLLHSNNFTELSLAMTSKYASDISNRMQTSLSKIKMSNLTPDEVIALDAACTILTHVFTKYSMELLTLIGNMLDTLTFIANEIDSGHNIVNYLPRQILTKTSTMPIDFDTYLRMENKAKKNHINRSVGFVVEETANVMVSAQKIFDEDDNN